MNGFDYWSREYSFDAQGKLVGISSFSDIAHECPDASGTPCAAIGEPQHLCADGGAGGQGGTGAQGGEAGGQGGAGLS